MFALLMEPYAIIQVSILLQPLRTVVQNFVPGKFQSVSAEPLAATRGTSVENHWRSVFEKSMPYISGYTDPSLCIKIRLETWCENILLCMKENIQRLNLFLSHTPIKRFLYLRNSYMLFPSVDSFILVATEPHHILLLRSIFYRRLQMLYLRQHCSVVATGPIFKYRTYHDYLTMSSATTEKVKWKEELLSRIKQVSVYAVLYFSASHYFTIDYAKSDEFYEEPLWYRCVFQMTEVFVFQSSWRLHLQFR